VPSERSRSSFGMALRGGGPAVVLLLDSHAAAAKLSGDWTATHEFLHLGVPRLPPEDAWLFEGLATYYTEIVRARAGSISGAQAYQHLLAGFERGQRQRTWRTLRTESAEMHARRAFFRVYWSGAALALLTDVATRRAGGTTLDSALRAFAACCASGEEEWTAERVLARLDAALGSSRYADLAHVWLDRSDFPAVSATLLDLGVSLGPRDEALFSKGRDSRIREEIVAKASQPSADR
jgi:predicted metalloprotease with PDZ domain